MAGTFRPEAGMGAGDVTPKAPVTKKPVKRAAAKPVKASAKRPATGDVVGIVTRVARQLGIPPEVALAIAHQESGLDPTSQGDHGYFRNGNFIPDPNGPATSFGLYNLHQGGELGSHDAKWAFDPANNARQALGVVAQVHAQHPEWDWGTVAAAAQRPADQAGYASSVNSILGGYHASGQKPIDYFKSSGPSQMTALGTNTPQTVQQYLGNPDVAAQYGYMAAYMKDPEVGPILAKAAQKGWNAGELLSALQKTHWWQKTSQTARQMQALQREDPASYREQYTQQQTQVQALAQSMGITIPTPRLNQLTTTALWSGWSNLQIQEAVGAEFKYTPGQSYAGTAGADIQKFKKLASDYLVPLADQTVGSWTKQALQGKINPDDFTGYLSEQAKTQYPWMAHAIDAGITPTQYLDPYRQAAAQTLEQDPNAINFNDPKWLSLVQATDPKTGQRTERGLANAMTEMRTNPIYGYDHTQGAISQASAFGAALAHQFGYQGDPGSGLSGVSNPAA